jgi:hypothetical protein
VAVVSKSPTHTQDPPRVAGLHFPPQADFFLLEEPEKSSRPVVCVPIPVHPGMPVGISQVSQLVPEMDQQRYLNEPRGLSLILGAELWSCRRAMWPQVQSRQGNRYVW